MPLAEEAVQKWAWGKHQKKILTSLPVSLRPGSSRRRTSAGNRSEGRESGYSGFILLFDRVDGYIANDHFQRQVSRGKSYLAILLGGSRIREGLHFDFLALGYLFVADCGGCYL